MKARVAALKGEVVVLEVERGHFPRVGDRVEISTRIGGETFPVGRWRVSKVSGRTVEAVEVDASAPASVGMTARITAAPAPPARAAATPPPPAATAAAPSERPPPPPAQRRGRREIPASAPLPWRQPKPPAPRAGRRELPPSEPLPWRRAEPAPSPPPPAARRSGPSGSEPPPWRRPRAAPPPHAVDPAPAAIASRTTRRYRLIWKDSGSGADEDFATFRPVPVDGFYPLGDRAVASPWPGVRYATPIDPAILVRPGAVDLARPVNYRLIWSSAGSWSDTPFSSWQPIPPRGYTCLGDVGSRSLAQKPSTDAIRCVPDRCVRAASLLDEIWKDRGSGADDDFSAWRIPGGLYVGNREHARPDRRVYALDAACLAEP